MKYSKAIIAIVLVCCAAPPSTKAKSLEAVYSSANQLAAEGQYRQALVQYDSLIDAGVTDPDLHFNLGVCWAQLKEYGRAIWQLELAHQLAPRDPAIREELVRVRKHVASLRAEREGEATIDGGRSLIESIVLWFPEDTLAGAWFCAELVFVALVLLLSTQRTRQRQLFVALSALALIIGSLSCWGLGVKRGWWRANQNAIVLDDKLPLREGPSPSAVQRGSAQSGDFARILDRYGEFYLISLAEGRQGWVQARNIGPL